MGLLLKLSQPVFIELLWHPASYLVSLPSRETCVLRSCGRLADSGPWPGSLGRSPVLLDQPSVLWVAELG